MKVKRIIKDILTAYGIAILFIFGFSLLFLAGIIIVRYEIYGLSGVKKLFFNTFFPAIIGGAIGAPAGYFITKGIFYFTDKE